MMEKKYGLKKIIIKKFFYQQIIMGANKLIGATGTPLGDCFLSIILGIFLGKVFKNFLKIFLKNICTIF
jgi:hypothetical protein